MTGNGKAEREALEVFGAFDSPYIAYVKPVLVEGKRGYAICATDGTALAVVAERELAFAVARQNDLEPLSVH